MSGLRREREEVSAFLSTSSPNQILAPGLINLSMTQVNPEAQRSLKTDQASA